MISFDDDFDEISLSSHFIEVDVRTKMFVIANPLPFFFLLFQTKLSKFCLEQTKGKACILRHVLSGGYQKNAFWKRLEVLVKYGFLSVRVE